MAVNKDPQEPDACGSLFQDMKESRHDQRDALFASQPANIRQNTNNQLIGPITWPIEHVFTVTGLVQVDAASEVHPLGVPPEVPCPGPAVELGNFPPRRLVIFQVQLDVA